MLASIHILRPPTPSEWKFLAIDDLFNVIVTFNPPFIFHDCKLKSEWTTKCQIGLKENAPYSLNFFFSILLSKELVFDS